MTPEPTLVLPKLELKKYTNGFDADTLPGPTIGYGSVVTWTYVFTNTGNVPLSNITLNDDKEGAVTTCEPANLPATLAVGASMTCVKTGIALLGQYTNTAVVTGTPVVAVNLPPAQLGLLSAQPSASPVMGVDLSHYTGAAASLGDYTWMDTNHNGVQDPGEPPFAGVLVTLVTPTGTVTTTTSAAGYYRFDTLVPGAPYSVIFTPPSGYSVTVNIGDVNNSVNSDADPATGATQPVVLTPGEFNPNLDAGIWKPAELTITKKNLSTGQVKPMQALIYEITVSNVGPTLATNIVITDPIPANTTYVADSAAPAAAFDGTRLVWTIASMAPQTSITVRFTTQVNTTTTASMINNIAVLGYENTIVLESNQVQNPLVPTAVTLDRFEAVMQPTARSPSQLLCAGRPRSSSMRWASTSGAARRTSAPMRSGSTVR